MASPAARNFARQHNIDINLVKGTGKDGRITNEDIMAYASKQGTKISNDAQANKPSIPTPPPKAPVQSPSN